MYCAKCGEQYQGGDRFCSKCGVDVTLKHELGNMPIEKNRISNYSGEGYQSKRKKKRNPWMIAGAIFFLIMVVRGQSINSNSSSDSATGEVAKNNDKVIEAAIPAVKEAIKVTSVDLYNDYEANVLRADSIYKGKLVEVTGVVTDISNSWNKPSITLNCNGGLFNSVTCNFKGQVQIDNITKLNKGDFVTLHGIVDGKIIGSVQIDKCEVITYENTPYRK